MHVTQLVPICYSGTGGRVGEATLGSGGREVGCPFTGSAICRKITYLKNSYAAICFQKVSTTINMLACFRFVSIFISNIQKVDMKQLRRHLLVSVDEVEELMFTASGLASGLERVTSLPLQTSESQETGAQINWSNFSGTKLFLQVEHMAHRIL